MPRAIKGFDAKLQCRDFQFEIGQTYRHDGEVKACKSGFHAIHEDAHPLSVFEYYAPAGSRFCVVEYDGATERDGEKVASEILTLQREIGINDLVQEAVAWVTARAKPEGETATGYRGAASATGDQGAASATGYHGAASATGDRGAAMSAGYAARVMGADGNAIFAVERDDEYNIVSVACGIAGRDGITPGAWYCCQGGKLVEVK